MLRRMSGVLACLSAFALLGGAAIAKADEVLVPGETYTADLIAPLTIDSYAERQAQGGGAGDPVEGGTWVPRAPAPGPLYRETIPQPAGDFTGTRPTLGLSRRGARSEDTLNQCRADLPCIPPDTMGAIGPNHFMEVINGNVSIFQKSHGLRIASETLRSFFRNSGFNARIDDPRVVFDQHSGRWIVIATDFDQRIVLAVSRSDDPTGSILKTSFQASAGSDESAWPDYPTLGVEETAMRVTPISLYDPEPPPEPKDFSCFEGELGRRWVGPPEAQDDVSSELPPRIFAKLPEPGPAEEGKGPYYRDWSADALVDDFPDAEENRKKRERSAAFRC